MPKTLAIRGLSTTTCGKVRDGVDPGIAGAQSNDRLHHPWVEILQDDKYQRERVADLIVASGTEKQLESHRREITALFCELGAMRSMRRRNHALRDLGLSRQRSSQ